MGITCSRCSGNNSKKSTFCSFCGNKLYANNNEVGQFAGGFNVRTQGNTSPYSLPQQMPAVMPTTPFMRQPVAQNTMMHQPMMQNTMMQQPMVQNTLTPIPVSLSMNNEGFSNYQQTMLEKLIKHGCLTSHTSWLLEGKHVQAFLVHSAILNAFRQHTLPGLKVKIEKWREQGVMEIRDYIMIQRGISTIFIYVVPSGRDLYLSRMTVVSPKLSSTKIAFASALFLFLLLGCLLMHSISALENTVYFSGTPSLYDTFLSSSAAQFTIPFLTILLLLFCILLSIRACVSWHSEKDPWQVFRSDHLSPLQIDDNALLEQATDNVIRNVVKQLGMETTNAKNASRGSLQLLNRLNAVGQLR